MFIKLYFCQVVLACSNNLYIASAERLFDPGLDTSQLSHFSAIAISANGKFIALFSSDTGRIWVVSANLKVNRGSLVISEIILCTGINTFRFSLSLSLSLSLSFHSRNDFFKGKYYAI